MVQLDKYHLNSDFDMVQTLGEVDFTGPTINPGQYTATTGTFTSTVQVPAGLNIVQMKMENVVQGVISAFSSIETTTSALQGNNAKINCYWIKQTETQIVIVLYITADSYPVTVSQPIKVSGRIITWRLPSVIQ